MPLIGRRSLLIGLSSLLVAPSIVRASSLMPINAKLAEAARLPLETWLRTHDGMPPSNVSEELDELWHLGYRFVTTKDGTPISFGIHRDWISPDFPRYSSTSYLMSTNPELSMRRRTAFSSAFQNGD